ncbi:putative DNA polymerase [Escherichia phage tootiki]|uniref:Putative DNA polymerase n=1 Tax=Escherichia phage tootiki TaxID=2696453 RepID=A0A6B9XI69_9CAUD|nr:putative DNA polymerase [Escherichia phage tootiki]
MFGAGDEKFAKTIKASSTEEGALTKQTYFVRLPKIKKLLDRLEEDFKATKKALEEVFGKTSAIAKGGYIKVAGAWLWCKSPHKLLNYTLMGSEAQVQNEGINLANRELTERKLTVLNGRKPAIGARWVCSYHDEVSLEVPTKDVPDVKEIIDRMYGQASKNLGLKSKTLVTGTGKVGKTWYAVH